MCSTAELPRPRHESRIFITCINHSLAVDHLPPKGSILSWASGEGDSLQARAILWRRVWPEPLASTLPAARDGCAGGN